MVKESDFEYREVTVPTPGAGEALIKTGYISLDPSMRGQMENRADYVAPLQLGDVMRAGAVGEVVASNNPSYPEGDAGVRRLRDAGLRGLRRQEPADAGVLTPALIPL